MTDAKLPPTLVEGLLRLCQGDFSYRMPRTHSRDEQDTIAFFVNTIAEEIGRILEESRAHEEQLGRLVERLSAALQAVAAGDFSVRVERDFTGDSADVLAFLVNNTASELALLVAESQRKAAEQKAHLERLVAERTAELERLATTDALTGALNRRRIFELGEAELARAARYDHPTCLAMLDLDDFKAINDVHGHAVGDAALRDVVGAVRGQLRGPDLLGRYGGDELVILFPETEADAAVVALERVRRRVAVTPITTPQGAAVNVTVSVGVVEVRRGESFDDAVRRADLALYESKRAGRDRLTRGT